MSEPFGERVVLHLPQRRLHGPDFVHEFRHPLGAPLPGGDVGHVDLGELRPDQLGQLFDVVTRPGKVAWHCICVDENVE